MGSYPYVFSSHWLQGFSSVPVTWGAQIQSPRKLENKVPGVPTSFNERTLKMSPKAKKNRVLCVPKGSEQLESNMKIGIVLFKNIFEYSKMFSDP